MCAGRSLAYELTPLVVQVTEIAMNTFRLHRSRYINISFGVLFALARAT